MAPLRNPRIVTEFPNPHPEALNYGENWINRLTGFDAFGRHPLASAVRKFQPISQPFPAVIDVAAL
jgi:hypothetical protein